MNYYQRLKDIREDADEQQTKIAEILEINQTQYSRYELGKNMMGIDKYIKLAKYYNVSLDYLSGIIEEPKPLYEKDITNKKDLTIKQKRLLEAYDKNPRLQEAIDKLLNL